MSHASRIKCAIFVASTFGAMFACGTEASDGTGTAGSSPPGSGGAGASGTGGGAGAGGSAGDAPGYGGTSPNACENLCAKFERLGCDLSACASLCPKWIEHAGDCAPEMAAEIDCIADATTQCGEDVCHAEFAALDACAGGVDCFGESCKGTSEGTARSCECSTGCSTGALQLKCATIGAETSCECYVGGRLVGTCEETLSYCSLQSGCCAAYF